MVRLPFTVVDMGLSVRCALVCDTALNVHRIEMNEAAPEAASPRAALFALVAARVEVLSDLVHAEVPFVMLASSCRRSPGLNAAILDQAAITLEEAGGKLDAVMEARA